MSAKAETIRADVRCAICEIQIPLRSLTSKIVGAPELFNAGESNWIGCFSDDDGNIKLIATCSKPCAEKLLSE